MRIEKDQFIVIGLMAGLALVFGLGVWKPARAERAQAQGRIDQLETQLQAVSESTRGLGQWHERVDLLKSRLQGAQQYVPRHKEQGQVIRGLNEALKTFGVADHEIVSRRVIHGPKFSVIPITLEFESSFPVVYDALKQIEQSPRLIRIERLSVQSDPRRPAKPAEVHLQLSTFFSDTAHGGQTNGGRS